MCHTYNHKYLIVVQKLLATLLFKQVNTELMYCPRSCVRILEIINGYLLQNNLLFKESQSNIKVKFLLKVQSKTLIKHPLCSKYKKTNC